MPVPAESATIVCNTGPLIAIAAATGAWEILQFLPERIWISEHLAREAIRLSGV
jgi:hypothetical protein